jgi:hypothetical protein
MSLALLAIVGLFALGPSAAPSDCDFHLVKGRWEGSCGPLFGQTPSFTLSPAKAIASGVWRKGARPTEVWAGTMTDSGHSDAAIEIEIYPDGTGALRSEQGWFGVSGFLRSGQAVRFQLDVSREIPPSDLDREIVQRAAGILSSESVWNRADDRECPRDATAWSIYCAMERATIDVTGAFHHRRPALQIVRQIVDERTVGREYHHRLMDYNNDPSTRLEDVRSLFAEAMARMGR